MSLTSNFAMLALYNARINKQLLRCCQALPIADLTRATHSFFPNIITYWNHLLFGDLIMLGRLANNNVSSLTVNDLEQFPKPLSTKDIYFEVFADIVEVRTQVDALIMQYCHHLTDKACEQVINYQNTEGVHITKKVADMTQHMFNHQTHHRGQLTCILSQMGVDYGCMDLPIIVSEGSVSKGNASAS